jgi:TonB family protein
MLSIKQSESQDRTASKSKQPRRLLLALLLLVLAFAAVIVRDHEFWFTSDQSSDLETAEPEATDQTTAKSAPAETTPVAATPAATTTAAPKQQIAAPTKPVQTKPVQTKPVNKTVVNKPVVNKPVVNKPVETKPVETKSAVAKAIAGPAAPKAAETKATEIKPAEAPVVATNRTAVAPLDVEVVAGDTHKTVRPGSNALKVEIMKSGTASHSTFAGATSAAEREHMASPTASLTATYPALAQNMKVQGSVVLQAFIGADGVIQNLRVLSGPAILASAAQQAVREWHFKPYLQNGQAVETKATITVNFTIKVGDNTAAQLSTGL